jgi:ferredoxin
LAHCGSEGLEGWVEFGYAAASGDGTVPPDQIEAAERAIAECPAAAVRRLA